MPTDSGGLILWLARTEPPSQPHRFALICLAGVLRIGFGTYFEAFVLAGLLLIAAALMVPFIGTGRRGVAEPATAKAY